MRRTNEGVEFPIVYYKHPETKRSVIFIAVIHLAEAEYFATLQTFIDSLKGYTVLYERVKKISKQEKKGLSLSERSIHRNLNGKAFQARQLFKLRGLVYQSQGLEYRSHWINADISKKQLIHRFAARGLMHQNKSQRNIYSQDFPKFMSSALATWCLNGFLKNAVAIFRLRSITPRFLSRRDGNGEIIIDLRNQIALNNILEQVTKSDVVTIWGAAHLEGIARGLKCHGFEECHREWILSYRVKGRFFPKATPTSEGLQQ